jgi:hypothetical protein
MALTSFCAANMAFIIGMYEADISGETDIMRIRGSEAGTLDSAVAAMPNGLSTLCRSAGMTN